MSNISSLNPLEQWGLLALNSSGQNNLAANLFFGLGGDINTLENIAQTSSLVFEKEEWSKFSTSSEEHLNKAAFNVITEPNPVPLIIFQALINTSTGQDKLNKILKDYANNSSVAWDVKLEAFNRFESLMKTYLQSPQPNSISIQQLDENLSKAKAEVIKRVIINGDLEAVKKLIKIPQDIDCRDYLGRTPLMNAAMFHQKEIVEFLLENGANSNLWSQTGKAIHLALIQGHHDIAQILAKNESDLKLAQFFMKEKMLCLRFGTNLQFKTLSCDNVHVEGHLQSYTFPELCNSLDGFIKSLQSEETHAEFKEYYSEALAILSKSIDNQKNLSKLLDVTQKEEIFALPVGYNKNTGRSHATGVVVSTKQNIYIKCDSAPEKINHSGLHVYEIDKKTSKEEIRKVLQNILDKKYTKEAEEYFNKISDDELKLHHLAHLKHKEQKAGNCSWTSAKLCLRSILYLLILERTSNPDQAKDLSYTLYKKWSKYDRKIAIDGFLKELAQIKAENTQISDWKEEGIVGEYIVRDILIKSQILGFGRGMMMLQKWSSLPPLDK